MKVLGNSKKNKYCAFCTHWYDPTNSALTAVPGRDLYQIDNTQQKKCNKHQYQTKALSTCKLFISKL
jgi:hypothetical protein